MVAHSPHAAVIRAHAKINLGLLVTGKRSDGYHDIVTVFHRIALADSLTLEPSPAITVHTSHPHVPSGEANICHAAARLVAAELGPGEGVRVEISKEIPVGAGLGGGSADAAALLCALPRFWGGELPPDTLRSLALRLGADVPYFLRSGSALGTGRGETLEYFTLDLPFAILLCTPPLHVSTAWAYGHVTPRARPGIDLRALIERGLAETRALPGALVNDFEEPVFRAHPAIASIRERLIREGAIAASMSGSGSSVYGLFASAADAGRARAAFPPSTCLTSVTPPFWRETP